MMLDVRPAALVLMRRATVPGLVIDFGPDDRVRAEALRPLVGHVAHGWPLPCREGEYLLARAMRRHWARQARSQEPPAWSSPFRRVETGCPSSAAHDVSAAPLGQARMAGDPAPPARRNGANGPLLILSARMRVRICSCRAPTSSPPAHPAPPDSQRRRARDPGRSAAPATSPVDPPTPHRRRPADTPERLHRGCGRLSLTGVGHPAAPQA